MAVSESYLNKMLVAVRLRHAGEDIRGEVVDLVNEARADLNALGVLKTKTEDEADPLILGAVRSFVRWKMASDESEAAANMNEYQIQRDELRRRVAYITEATP